MSRTRKAAAVALAAGLLFAGCSKKDDVKASGGEGSNEASSATSKPASTEAPATSEPKGTTTTTVDTSNDGQIAKDALIGTSDLPPGEWSTDTSSSSSSSDSGELLDVPTCKALVTDVEAAKAKATGKASEQFSQGTDQSVVLGNDVEIYASRDAVRQIGTVTDSKDFSKCFLDFIRTQQGSDEGTLSDITVTAFNVDIDKDALKVDFVTGLNIRFTLEFSGNTVNAVVRAVFVGVDRGLTIVNVAAFEVPGMTAPVDIESLEIAPTVRAAAKSLKDALAS